MGWQAGDLNERFIPGKCMDGGEGAGAGARRKILSGKVARQFFANGGLYDMLDNNMIYDSLRVNHCVSRW